MRTISLFRPLGMLLYGSVAASLLLLNACGGGGGGGSSPAVISSIVVSPINGSVIITMTQQFTATAIFTDGTKKDVTGSSTWASSDPTIATVDAGGIVHGVSNGTTTLSASSNQTTGTTSVTSGGGILMKLSILADGGTIPQISDGGRFVVFGSNTEIYEQDTCIGVDQNCTPQTLLVSASMSGSPGSGTSFFAAMSADGRFVAFYSSADNLVAGSLGPAIYLRDTCVGPTAASTCVPTTTLVSVSTDGIPLPIGNCCFTTPYAHAVSLDAIGRFLFFLVPDPSTGFPGDPANPPCSTLYIRDTCNQDGSSCVASTNNLGRLCGAIVTTGVNIPPILGRTSGDGRYLATFSPYVCGPHFGEFTHNDVWDTCAGVKECTPASVFRLPESSCSAGFGPSLSRTGRFISFSPVPDPTGPPCTTCVYDQCVAAPNSCTKGYTEAGIDTKGNPLGSANPIISADGRFVAISPSTYRDTCLQVSEPCTPKTVIIPLTFQNDIVEDTAFFSMSSDARFVTLAPFETCNGCAGVPVYIAITGLNSP